MHYICNADREPKMNEKLWYYSIGQDRKGPVSEAALAALVAADAIRSDTKVWCEGMTDWEPAYRHIPGVVPPAPGMAGRPMMSRDPAAAGGRDYFPQVGMIEAFSRAFSNYATFSGRSSRAEYWWFVLVGLIISIVLVIIDYAAFGPYAQFQPFSTLWSLAVLLPNLAVGARRLHDINKSGWWLLISLVPLIGLILLLVWFCQKGDAAPNNFG